MNNSEITLNSVNWEHGMLLTPDHFLRQERYFDSAMLWMLRYTSSAAGLVGGGPRVPEEERGVRKHDPIVDIDEDDESLSVSVSQCRGITPSGCFIEIGHENAVHCCFPKVELEGVSTTNIFVVCDAHRKETVDGVADDFNPQMRTERRLAYEIALRIDAGSVANALVVGRLRRAAEGVAYEKAPDFIPACTTMTACSQLMGHWRDITAEVLGLLNRYNTLHRAMQQFIVIFKERGLETETDLESIAFAGRMVVALQACLYELLDPLQGPQHFFGQLRRFIHSAAVYLNLSPPVQQFYEMLKASGEIEYLSLVEQQIKILAATPKLDLPDDLSVEARSVRTSLATLSRLERALEGKYIDFRFNRSLEAMNFVFDRSVEEGQPRLYRLSAKPSRVQAAGADLTIVFAPLKLEGREKYRLILVGEQTATFEIGTRISVTIRINVGSGFNREPVYVTRQTTVSEQCNLEFDFDAPDVPTITDLRVAITGHIPIRSGLLFVRERFFVSKAPEVSKPPMDTGTVLDAPSQAASAAGSPVQGKRPTPPTPSYVGPRRDEPKPGEPPKRRRME